MTVWVWVWVGAYVSVGYIVAYYCVYVWVYMKVQTQHVVLTGYKFVGVSYFSLHYFISVCVGDYS